MAMCNIITPFDIVETASLPMAISAQHAELHNFKQAYTSDKDNTANIYTDSRYVFRGACEFGMLRKQYGFPISSGNKTKNVPYGHELLNATLSPAALAIIKSLEYSKLDCLGS